ncbi:hypothetical protein BD324DRAFT_637237 [Kockovaella imperatae]|uniref:Uncharacterized protein n=1 Tax=Kockovaella imperatae TaxID=4999 RepID=A0A1Y1U9Q7_9TREE|nr:hypothetical protein BD324DRAFT_637237 [Kockovaella imperatae]ORX34247.1 hypothetical protein BD324DRAFT_637237 [Kockovaella imperatae]
MSSYLSNSSTSPRQASFSGTGYEHDDMSHRPRSHSSSSRANRPSVTSRHSSRGRRPSTAFTGSSGSYSEGEDDDEDEEWENGARVGRKTNKKKKDEPMSPVVVVFYVTALYIIFQILTRSDEHEILAHLPQSLRGRSPVGLGGSNVHSDVASHQHYAFPYHLPHLNSPLPSSSETSPGFWRSLLGIVIYPLYLIITLLAIPVPLLLNTAHLILSVLSTVLYPLTSTIRILGRTFILGPLGMIRSMLGVFYPIYTFVGGVIGVGCVMGMGAGWVGQTVLDLIYGKSKNQVKKSSRRRDRSTISARTSSEPVNEHTVEATSHSHATSIIRSVRHSSVEPSKSKTQKSGPLSSVSSNVNPSAARKLVKPDKQGVLDKFASNYEDEYRAEVPLKHTKASGDGVTTGREAQAIGTRKRLHASQSRTGEIGKAW